MRSDEIDLVTALRAGDEAAFTGLVTEWSRSMRLVARTFVAADASAEEVVQDTWLAVIKGLDGFEGRSSLRTWVYRILVNTAKRRGEREGRTIPWTSLAGDLGDGPAFDPTAFQGPGESSPGAWRSAPAAWPPEVTVEDSVLATELREHLEKVLETLPVRQRLVVTLRDVLGHDSAKVCELLEISAANQRVLLHRGRTAVRAALAVYLEER